jgi:integrase
MRTNFGLSPSQKLDARRALAKIAGMGIMLESVVDHYLRDKRPLVCQLVAEASDNFLKSRIVDGCRRATVDWYDEHLKHINEGLGHRLIDEVTRGEFKKWLDELDHKPTSKAGTARCARALWNWAIKHDPPLAIHNVTIGCKFSVKPKGGGSQKYLPVEMCEKIMHNIDEAHRSAVALLLFGGIRPEEVCGAGKDWLRWEHIDTEGRTIKVPQEIAKVGPGRLIERIPETIWHFLKPGDPRETVAKIQSRSLLDNIKRAGGITGRDWPQDALRHTCATYAVADLTDISFVAHWLGNSVPIMRLHYVGLVKRNVAQAFWAIRPK